MAITLLGAPRSPALSGDDNYLVLTTSLPTASTRPGYLITGLPADGDTLNLYFGGRLVQMAFATTPDNSGLQLRAAAGQTQEEYHAQLLEGFFSIPAIESAFIIEAQTDGVRLTLRGPVVNDLEATSAASLTVTIFGGNNNDNYPNLTAALLLYVDDNPSPLLRLKGAYDTMASTHFNLGNVLPLELGLPLTASLGSSPTYAAHTPEGWAEYYFRYADQYGRPAQPEKLTKSPTYDMVAGGSAGSSLYRWGGSGNLQMCHAYFDEAGQYFAKPVSYEQPDWIYFFVKVATSSTVSVEVFFNDGTSETRTVLASTSFAKGLHCLPSGGRQCGIEQVPNYANKEAVRYVWSLPSIGFNLTYDLLPDCHPWEQVIAYENGAGGIETVAMRGKSEGNYRATKQDFRRARTRVQSVDKGAVGYYNVEGGEERRLRSGYYSEAYITHLRQVLLGRTWLVDQQFKRFIAININGTLNLPKDDDDLHALELTFTYATPDRGAHYL